jgi:hypothetical protein
MTLVSMQTPQHYAGVLALGLTFCRLSHGLIAERIGTHHRMLMMLLISMQIRGVCWRSGWGREVFLDRGTGLPPRPD